MQSAPDNLFSCRAGVCGGCIDAYGYFHLCMMLRHPDYAYDLKKGTLKDALVNFFPNIRKTKVANPDYMSRCAKCFIKGICWQCPAKSWTEHGVLDKPVEYLCENAHAQARYLGFLSEHEKAWEVVDWKRRIAELSAEH
jgi:radical SAM protein with 4Fe4S-binding SPASM domain